jgi:hypothetical protein
MKTELNNVWLPSDGEIALFRKMSAILSANYHVTFVGETHQHYVEYHSYPISRPVVREISDLLIIAFSSDRQRARMTFLQAKYHRGNLVSSGTFKGDFFQYELLSVRPQLTRNIGGRFNFPMDILSFGCCHSLGSYGVFYINNRQIDLAYCAARDLTVGPHTITYGQNPVSLTIPAAGGNARTCTCNSCTEITHCYNIDDFTNHILALEIGAELQLFPHQLSFIKSMMAALPPDAAGSDFMRFANDFLTGFTDNGDGGNDERKDNAEEGLPFNVLLINVDGKENRSE